jgi:flagellar hook-associated protein 2
LRERHEPFVEEGMSDITIPGVTSKYNTDKTIKALVDAERIPLQRLEQDRETYQEQKRQWLSLNTRLTGLRESARSLFGFQNPFNEKIAVSSSEHILRAVATRAATEAEKKIVVRQIATPDRFMSRSLDKDFRVAAGTYTFSVGEKEISFSFAGGSLQELATAINTKSDSLLKASIIDDTGQTRVMVIEATRTGARQRLSFDDQALIFAREAGVLEPSPAAVQNVPIDRFTLQTWETAAPEGALSVADGVLTVNPGGQTRIPLPSAVQMNPEMVLELKIRTRLLPEETAPAAVPPSGPALPEVGAIEYGGITVESAPWSVDLPEWRPPQLPARVDDRQMLFASGAGQTLALPEVDDSDEFISLRFAASELPPLLETLDVRNRNTHRIVEIRDIVVFDRTARGEYRPVHPLATAQDALLEMDGVEVIREQNEIDDLLPGVTLNLLAAGDEAVTLTVERDRELIKNTVINFIGTYNRLLTQIDILTRRDEAVIEDARFLDDDEREDAYAFLGLFQGNITLMQLKSTLQRLMMNSYPTAGGRELTLLAQIGIATDASGSGRVGTLDKTRLRGYLEMNESKFDQVASARADWVRELFGVDTDKDLIIDSGVAYALDSYLKTYLDTGGIVSTRLDNLNNLISRKEREIQDYNEHLVEYEAELRRKYGIMEGALDSLEQSSQALENFNKQNTP